MDQRETIETMAEYRHTSKGLKSVNHETMLKLAERHFELAAKGRPDEAPSMMEVGTEQYLDPALFERERRAIFNRYPVVAGLSRDLPNPGDYIKLDDMQAPLFVTRTKSGKVKAFINGCRHRGTALVTDERGCGKAIFSCPYHGWGYSPDGELVSVPNAEAFEGLNKKNYGLIEVECEERHGIIFVAPNAGEVLNLDKHLGKELSDELASWGFDVVNPAHHAPLPVKANWKLVLGTFLETYHFKATHKNNLALVYNCNVNTVDAYKKNLRVSISMNTLQTEYAKLPEDERIPENYVHVAYLMFPGMILINNAQVLQMFRIFPKSVNETLVQFSTYSRLPLDNPENKALFEDVFRNAIEIVTTEDFDFGAVTSQRAIDSGALKTIIFGANELPLQLMEQSIQEAMREIG